MHWSHRNHIAEQDMWHQNKIPPDKRKNKITTTNWKTQPDRTGHAAGSGGWFSCRKK